MFFLSLKKLAIELHVALCGLHGNTRKVHKQLHVPKTNLTRMYSLICSMERLRK